VLTTPQVSFAAGFGVARCTAWLVLTVSGSRLLTWWLGAVGRLASPSLAAIYEYANPLRLAIIDGMS
jgi:hypothetical protein